MKFSRLLAMLCLLALASLSAWAQGTAQIQGVIQDASGSAVPGAEVKVIQTATAQTRTTTSGGDGRYVLPNLPLGPYRVEVSKPGFTKYVQTGITLQVDTNPTVDIALKVGNVVDTVEVEANAALVETQATGVGNVIENKRILELPLNGRQATDLIGLTGAVITQGTAGNGGYPGTQQYSIGGGQSFGVAFWLDGSSFNNPWDNANMPFPFPDALQEFKVETSSLTAANGVHAGGTINAVTKSGTNAFHGDVFEFLRNGDMNGTNYSTHTNDGLKRNQFGGTVGGPVKKDKIFFFFGYQGTITRQDAFSNVSVPTAAMIAGNFSACPTDISGLTAAAKANFVGNVLAPGIKYDPAAVKLANLLPNSGVGPCGQTTVGLVTQIGERQYVARGDYQASDKNTIFGRYVRSQYYRPPSNTITTSNILTTTQGGLDDADQTFTGGDTYLISSNMVNQFRASLDRTGIHRFDDNFVSSCDVGVQNIYCGYTPHQSTFAIGSGSTGFSVGPGTGGQAAAHSTTYQLNDDVSWVKGAHQINFGMGGELYRLNFLGNVYSQNSWTFPNIPQFLLGNITTLSESAPNPLVQEKWFMNAYVQDTWKASNRLTVNVGLRWEPSLPPGMLNKAAYNFSYANLIAGVKSTTFVNAPPGLIFPGDPGFQGLAGVKRQWDLFAPRVALGWDPKGDGKMTIRASFGIAYDFVNGSMYVNSADSPPFGNTTIVTPPPAGTSPNGQFSNPFSSAYGVAPGLNIFPYSLNANTPFVTGGTYIAEQPNNKATAVNQWNFVIQRQIGKDWVATATYLGSESSHLLSSYDTNPTIAGKRLFTINNIPNAKYYNDVDILDSSGTSSYNGLILDLKKRLSKGFITQANYTWSHCIGDLTIGNSTGNAGGGYQMLSTANGYGLPSNRRYDRSNCQSIEIGGTFSSDRRQIFNWTNVYETPKFASRTTTMLLSGWQLSGIYRYQSAPWLTVGLSTDVTQTGVFTPTANLRPNYIGGVSPYCSNPGPAAGSCFINSAAFASPATGTFGNLGRDSLRGPIFFQFDAKVSREFRIREGYTLEFRAEAFNLSNSQRAGISLPSLAAGGSGLNLVYGTPGFGSVTSSLDPRILQMAAKFVF